VTVEERLAALESEVERLGEMLALNPRRTYMQDVIRWRLLGALPMLLARHPDGVTAEHVAAHFSVPKGTTIIALRNLARSGKIQYVRVKGRNDKLVVPLGQRAPETVVTAAQKRVFDAVEEAAAAGQATISIRQISDRIGTHPNTIYYAMHQLVLKKRLAVIGQRGRFKPSTYAIVAKSSDEDIWKAAFR
jgi:hypothetical protein